MPSPAQADIICTQFGSDTFHIGSTIKFQWNDTQTTPIDTFNLNLYCVQNSKMIQTITTLNQTSPSPVSWIVNSSLASYSSECPLNQYQGAFEWSYTDSNGAAARGQAKCKVILLVGTGAQTPAPGTTNPNDGSDPMPADEPQPSDIVVSDKTKTIVIGVGCAVGALVLAGFIGFYYIRYCNKRAAEEQASRKLREPIRSGPLFAPRTGGAGGASGSTIAGGAGGAAARYNELASITTGSVGSPATTRTEMVELGPHPAGPPTSAFASPALGSRSPTPIAAAHAKLSAPTSPSLSTSSANQRPASLLTSSFIPSDEIPRSSSPNNRNPFEKRENEQYEQELQQQQQHQIQQQQQQQQQQNYGSYPY
ncbi:hypothetical protein BGX28_002772 [Mortierella sp. GBA30]|nr:hypothetical protein BGX28_002772 [Mortierella sp. GBA30]